MFGKLGDMMGKLQEMKQKAEEAKLRLAEQVISTELGDVRIKITGDRKLVELEVAPALQHGDKASLEKNLMQAINNALVEVEKLNEEELKKAAGGLLPGL